MTPPRSSEELVAAAQGLTPGGVHSNVRLSGPSRFIERAAGAWLYDVDGNDYVDHLLGQGPNFLGHAPASVTEKVEAACRDGMVFGGQHPLEVQAAQAVIDAIGWAENVRFGLSGTEMVQAAIRLARAHTGRRRIIRFEGHYHGWLDNILMAYKDGSWGTATAGQTDDDLAYQIVLPWNDANAVADAFEQHGDDIAAIITEPMMINAGAIEPRAGYLESLRSLTREHGAVLIFDEVISGFRLALGGAAERFAVVPDIALYGKALAGGWPVAALAGSRSMMEPFGTGVVNHSGTFNSNAMGMAAVIATLDELTQNPPYERIAEYGTALQAQLRRLADEHDLDLHLQGLPVAFHASFGEVDAHDARSLLELDGARYAEFAKVLTSHGVWVAGRGIWYTSAAHGDHELDAVVERADAAMAAFKA
jgi:glutamate-1-semialdehyde 2,1-aminomutase